MLIKLTRNSCCKDCVQECSQTLVFSASASVIPSGAFLDGHLLAGRCKIWSRVWKFIVVRRWAILFLHVAGKPSQPTSLRPILPSFSLCHIGKWGLRPSDSYITPVLMFVSIRGSDTGQIWRSLVFMGFQRNWSPWFSLFLNELAQSSLVLKMMF